MKTRRIKYKYQPKVLLKINFQSFFKTKIVKIFQKYAPYGFQYPKKIYGKFLTWRKIKPTETTKYFIFKQSPGSSTKITHNAQTQKSKLLKKIENTHSP